MDHFLLSSPSSVVHDVHTMSERDRRRLVVHRRLLLNGLEDVQPILDSLVERDLLSPESVEYQQIVANEDARDRTQQLLDTLPNLGPGAFAVFLESLASCASHLYDTLHQGGDEEAGSEACSGLGDPISALCEGEYPPAVSRSQLVCRLQKLIRKRCVRSGRECRL